MRKILFPLLLLCVIGYAATSTESDWVDLGEEETVFEDTKPAKKAPVAETASQQKPKKKSSLVFGIKGNLGLVLSDTYSYFESRDSVSVGDGAQFGLGFVMDIHMHPRWDLEIGLDLNELLLSGDYIHKEYNGYRTEYADTNIITTLLEVTINLEAKFKFMETFYGKAGIVLNTPYLNEYIISFEGDAPKTNPFDSKPTFEVDFGLGKTFTINSIPLFDLCLTAKRPVNKPYANEHSDYYGGGDKQEMGGPEFKVIIEAILWL